MLGFELRLGRRPTPAPPDQLPILTLADAPEDATTLIQFEGQQLALVVDTRDGVDYLEDAYAWIFGEWIPLAQVSRELSARIIGSLKP